MGLSLASARGSDRECGIDNPVDDEETKETAEVFFA